MILGTLYFFTAVLTGRELQRQFPNVPDKKSAGVCDPQVMLPESAYDWVLTMVFSEKTQDMQWIMIVLLVMYYIAVLVVSIILGYLVKGVTDFGTNLGYGIGIEISLEFLVLFALTVRWALQNLLATTKDVNRIKSKILDAKRTTGEEKTLDEVLLEERGENV